MAPDTLILLSATFMIRLLSCAHDVQSVQWGVGRCIPVPIHPWNHHDGWQQLLRQHLCCLLLSATGMFSRKQGHPHAPGRKCNMSGDLKARHNLRLNDWDCNLLRTGAGSPSCASIRHIFFQRSHIGTAHIPRPFSLKWPASGKPKDLGSWLLADNAVIHARTGTVISFALNPPWAAEWLAWCHDGRHIIRLQSHLRRRLLCTLDAATGHIVAGPRECAPGMLEVSDRFGHSAEGHVSPTADVILVPEQTSAISMLQLPALRPFALVVCPLYRFQPQNKY